MDLSLFSGSPIPRETRDEINALGAEFENLRAAESTRLTRYKTYREESERSRDVDEYYVAQGKGGPYNERRQVRDGERHNISLPFGMALTVKHAYRIAGRLPDAIVDRREETAQERYRSDTIEKLWWAILHESDGETLMATGGWDGSQLGAACFEPYFDVDKQMPLIRAVDPAGVLVVRGIDNPHNFQRVYRFWQAPLATVKAEYRDVTFDGYPCQVEGIESTHKVGQVPMVTLVQVKDKNQTIRFALGGSAKDSIPLLRVHHGLGFTPFVVIPNIGPERDVWGWADYEFYRALAAYIPALFSREADIIRMVANGAVIEKGTGQDPNTVKGVLRDGGVLPSRRDGSVEPISAPEVPTFESEHATRALEMLKMLGFAPDAAWGGSDTRSGADRALQLQPLVEFTAMKQTNWAAGLKRLASMCFRMMEDKQVSSAIIRGTRPGSTPGQRKAFAPFKLGPNQPPVAGPPSDPLDEEMIEYPATPKDLFQGDYSIRFFWQNRIDPDDPAYVTSELAKFQQGVQSARTTLERLGVMNPEDELKVIEDEAARLPWLRSGMIALIQAQLRNQASGDQSGAGQGNGGPESGQGQGGGAPTDLGAQLGSALDTFGAQGNQGGALNADAGHQAIGTDQGQLYGGA